MMVAMSLTGTLLRLWLNPVAAPTGARGPHTLPNQHKILQPNVILLALGARTLGVAALGQRGSDARLVGFA